MTVTFIVSSPAPHPPQAREAGSGADHVTTEATVILTDINDETPTFRSATYTAEVSESAQRHLPLTFLGSAVPQVFDYDQVRQRERGGEKEEEGRPRDTGGGKVERSKKGNYNWGIVVFTQVFQLWIRLLVHSSF